MADQKMMIGMRNKKGQISYLSDGLSLPEFIDLFKPKGQVQVLVDYSPVIEALHELHKATSSEDIRTKYNAMINYWRDAKTYTQGHAKLLKSDELCKQANFLINELHLKLQKDRKELRMKWHSPLNELSEIVKSIKSHSDIYIDALLCFIHSKASLDIDSFKGEAVLSGYGKFLQEFASDIYSRLLRSHSSQDSFLKFIAFEQPEKLQDYLNLEGHGETSDQFLLRLVKQIKPQDVRDEYGYYRRASICFDYFSPEYISIVEVFRDLLYKISSVNAFLEKLRAGSYEWDDSSESVDALLEHIGLLR